MKNKLTDLNDHLFAQLERLVDEDLQGDELHQEIARGRAVSMVAKDIVANAKTIVDAKKLVLEWGERPEGMPALLE